MFPRDGLDDDRLYATEYHSMSDLVSDRSDPLRLARRSVQRTLARVPHALERLRKAYQQNPFLTEIGFGPGGPRGDENGDKRPMSAAEAEALVPVYHIAKYARGRSVSLDVFRRSFDRAGVLRNSRVLVLAVRSGGLEPEARPAAWPFLAGVFHWNSSKSEREVKLLQMRQKFQAAVAQAKEEVARCDVEMEQRALEGLSAESDTELTLTLIRKDVIRTDRNIAEYSDDDSALLRRLECILHLYARAHPEVGYCQGMSDLLSPTLWVLRNEEPMLAFYCFESLMQRGLAENFLTSGDGIKAQLGVLGSLLRRVDSILAERFDAVDPGYHSLYRWVLVQFKRELRFSDIVRLWEVIWLDERPILHLYTAVGLLVRHRDKILESCTSFDRLLKFINLMAQRMDVDLMLHDALQLQKEFPCTDDQHDP